MVDELGMIPGPAREIVQAGLVDAFGRTPLTEIEPVLGGASGASTYRAVVGGRPYLLRIERPRVIGGNPHHYAAMRTAAAAGIAPRLHLADDAAGVAIMDFVPARPMAEFPGGPLALAAAAGALIARLQATSVFPVFDTFPALLERLLTLVRSSGAYAPGLFDAAAEAYARIREAYPWDAVQGVSSHNDPNPRNILFDGERLWLIDWETAYRNEPLVDVAILTHELAAGPELEAALVRAWSGRAPTPGLTARIGLMRLLTQLNYAGVLLAVVGASPGEPVETDLTPPTLEAFQADLISGRLRLGTPPAARALGKMVLGGFLAGVAAPGFADRLLAARDD